MSSAGLSYAGCGEYNHQSSHFLESCFLCQKQLAQNSDIFMYRGNTPFCSQECRQEQIEIDEAKDKRWKKIPSSSSKNTLRQATTAESTKKPASTVAVA